MQVQAEEAQTLMISIWQERQVYRQNLVAQKRLGIVGNAVLQGYHLAINHSEAPDVIGQTMANLNAELRGFAYEGVGMGLTQYGMLSHQGLRPVAGFATDSAILYHNWIYVGVGLILARAAIALQPMLGQLSPSQRWLVIDGYAYHHGVFNWRDTLDQHIIPDPVWAEDRFVFDQGLGRSIWFVDGGVPQQIAQTIQTFPRDRQPDLWGGVGYACAYAGGADLSTLRALAAVADHHFRPLSTGAALAAKARVVSGCSASCTELACQVWWQRPAAEVAAAIAAPSQDDSSHAQGWYHYRSQIPHYSITSTPHAI